MDIQMPGHDGFEATADIRELDRSSGAHSFIVAMTAHALKGDRQRCLAAGMDDYISKPIAPDALDRVIERVTAGIADGEASPAAISIAGAPQDTEKEVFDPESALAIVGGDIELLKEVAGIFLSNLPNAVAQIEGAVSARDAPALERAAHFLKGAAGSISARTCFELAYEMELMGAESGLDRAEDALAELRRAVHALEPRLKGFVSGEGA
jgi:CheY-like chemotaxis protein